MDEIKILTSKEYPPLLNEINDPPKKLYIRGSLPQNDTKYLTVVGSRKFTPYGREVCEELIAGLSKYNVTIVSGLALGIDAIAHSAALKAGLKTIAFPGSGLLDKVLYPRTNLGLAHQILESGGALISEFEPDTTAMKYMFLKRNRLEAGMSNATLIIESVEKSGTLVTARLAMEYNREVLTVPGSIYSTHTKGPHALIKDGATPITCSEDILDALHLHQSTTITSLENLTSDEQKIVKTLATPLSKDELIDLLDMPISNINITLSTLEIKGVTIERLGKIHIR